MENRVRGSGVATTLLLALLLTVSPVRAAPPAAPPSPPQAETPPGKVDEALARAKRHMEEAMRALGEAGSEAYREHAPGVTEKAGKAMDEAQRLLEEMRRKLENPPPPPVTPPKNDGRYI